MRGDKTAHGFEAAFLLTREQVALATTILRDRAEAFKVSKRKVWGFGGTRGWRIGAKAADEARVASIVHYALLSLFKAGDSVQTLIDTHRWSEPYTRPAGTLGTVTKVYAGDLHVIFDDEPDKEWNVSPTWFKVV